MMAISTGFQRSFIVAMLGLILAVCADANASIIHVRASADPGGNGQTWAISGPGHAFRFLQDALAVAQSGDQVWVMAGTYYPDENTANPNGTGLRSARFDLIDGVSLYGNFDGTESSLNERVLGNVSARSILSGDIDNNDPDVAGNTLHVVYSNTSGLTGLIDGFTITSGNADLVPSSENEGGGVRLLNGASPTFRNCRFVDNRAANTGGAFANSGLTNDPNNAAFQNCLFARNWGQYGGAVDCRGGVTFTNCTFVANVSTHQGSGATFFVDGTGPTIRNCILFYNDTAFEVYLGIGTFTLSVSYCCIEGGWAGAGNISAIPRFFDAASIDVRLLPLSPCVDAGDSSAVPIGTVTDLAGLPRFQNMPGVPDTGNPGGLGITVDMGVFEVQGESDFEGPARWTNPSGGDFGVLYNWFPGIPGPSSTVVLDLQSEYSIVIDQPRTITALAAHFGDVTFDLAAGDCATLATTAPALVVGQSAGDSASLTVINGRFSGVSARLGDAENAIGSLTVGSGGALTFDQDLTIGVSGTGVMRIENGGYVACGNADIGSFSTAQNCQVTVIGQDSQSQPPTPSTWDVPFFLSIDRGNLDVRDEGVVRAGLPGLFGGVFLFDQGSITGDGTIEADVINFGKVLPSVPGSPLTIEGRYVQVGQLPVLGSNSGRLEIDVTQAGRSIVSDSLDVSNNASLGGSLIIKPNPPTLDLSTLQQPLDILNASTIGQAGQFEFFDVAVLPPISNNKYMKVCYGVCNQSLGTSSVTLSIDDLASLFGFGTAGPETVIGIPTNAVRGDFDGVNGDDLAITVPASGNSPGSVLICLNNGPSGGGTFTTTPYTVGINPRDVVVGNFDNLPGVDVAVVNAGATNGNNAGSINVLGNDGSGGFAVIATVNNVADHPEGLAAGNLDSTGADDLIVTNTGTTGTPGNTIRIFINPGGAFPVIIPHPVGPKPVGTHPIRVTVGDADGDRFLDIYALSNNNGQSAGTVTVYRNNFQQTPGNFGSRADLTVGSNPTHLAVNTLDQQDGISDIVTVNDGDDTISVVISQATATTGYAPAVNLPLNNNGQVPAGVALTNLEPLGDADIDVAVLLSDGASGSIQVLRNDSAPGEPLALTQTPPTVVDGDPQLLVAGAFDPVAGTDLLTVNESTSFNGGSGSSGRGSLAPSNDRYMRVLPIDDPNACIGDVSPLNTGNGVVNIDDLVIVITHWGATGSDPADINHDNVVNIDDLVALITNWGPCP